jgi:hypothetical protein
LPKAALVSCLLLVVAVLAFAGLGYQQVPMSTTSTSTWNSYPPYAVTNTATYTATTIQTVTLLSPVLMANLNGAPYEATTYVVYATSTYTFVQPLSSIYEIQRISTIPETQTLSSTSLVPESATLGLTDGSFIVLAAIVIGILALLTAYLILKPRTRRKPKQATLSQFAS